MPQSMIDVPAELAAMEKMAAKELRAKYEELYGEASRSGKRCRSCPHLDLQEAPERQGEQAIRHADCGHCDTRGFGSQGLTGLAGDAGSGSRQRVSCRIGPPNSRKCVCRNSCASQRQRW